MTSRQIRILWCSGVSISVLLFHLGIIAPHFAARELAVLRTQVEGRADWEVPRAVERKEDLERRSEKNYYVGLVAPVAILSVCGLVAAGPRRRAFAEGRALQEVERDRSLGSSE